jgi:hypothetical protein
MDIIKGFLQSEINTQELYNDIINFITSYHVRVGEYEGNEYIIKKVDQANFIIFSEYDSEDGAREIQAAEAVYREKFIKSINEYALNKGLELHYK